VTDEDKVMTAKQCIIDCWHSESAPGQGKTRNETMVDTYQS